MKNSDRREVCYERYVDAPAVLALAAAGIAAVMFAGGYVMSENYVIAGVFSVCATVFAMREFIKTRREKTISKLEREFADVMQAVLSSVCAGAPPERAFAEIDSDGGAGLSGDRLMMREVHIICQGMKLNYPFDMMLEKFAARSGSAEIRNFANVLSITTAKGGNVPYAIRSTLANMRVKIETEQEIDRTLSMPVYNQRVMMAMPFAIVMLIKTISADYMSVMYETAVGKTVVVLCSCVIGAAWVLGNRLCRIEV